jgi:putative transposase
LNVSFPARLTLKERGSCREEEAFFGRADRVGAEGGGAWHAGGGAHPEGRHSEQTFYRWKKVYGGLEPSQARKLKQLEEENAKLKRLVADLSLDKIMLQDVLKKK